MPAELLDGYLEDLAAVSTTGAQLGVERLRARHHVGARAAADGVALRGLIDFMRQVAAAMGAEADWRVGLGRPQSGPGGAVRSFEQARYALDIAERLGLPGRLHKAADLLVHNGQFIAAAVLHAFSPAVIPRPAGDRKVFVRCGGASRWDARTVTAGPDTVVLVVQDGDSTSPEEVADWVRECLDGWLELDVVLVRLVVGELFDNARRHGSPPYVLELVLDRWREALVVSVRDRAVRRSTPWRSSAGLVLVDGLSSRWGVLTKAAFTTVWAELVFED